MSWILTKRMKSGDKASFDRVFSKMGEAFTEMDAFFRDIPVVEEPVPGDASEECPPGCPTCGDPFPPPNEELPEGVEGPYVDDEDLPGPDPDEEFDGLVEYRVILAEGSLGPDYNDPEPVEQFLNEMAYSGWELVAWKRKYMIFVRDKAGAAFLAES